MQGGRAAVPTCGAPTGRARTPRRGTSRRRATSRWARTGATGPGAGHDVHGGQAQPRLEPALPHGQRLDAGVRHGDRAAGEPAGAQQHRRRRVGPAVAPPGQRVEPPGRPGSAPPRRCPCRRRARRRPTPATGTQGATSESTSRASSSVPTGSSVVSRWPSLLARAARPGDVDPDPPPPDRPPPQRLHELERLDAVQRDRRRPQVGEPLLDPHAGAGVGEVEVAVDEQLLDPVEGDADRDRQQRGDAGQGQRPDAADPGPEQPEGEERAERDGRPVQDRRDEEPAVGHLEHRLQGRAGVRSDVARQRPARPGCRSRRPPVGGRRGDLVGAPGEVEQVLAQRLGAAEVEEGQGERGVGPARRLHDHPGQPEQPCEQRPRQLDGLHPLQAHLPVLAEQDALAQLDLATTDAEAGEAPAHPVDPGDHPEEERERGEGDERVGHRLLERVATGVTRVVERLAVGAGEERAEAELTTGSCRRAARRRSRGSRAARRHLGAAATGGGAAATPPRAAGAGSLTGRPAGPRHAPPAGCAGPRPRPPAGPGSEPPLSGEAVWISHEAMPLARASGPDWMSTYWSRP